MYALLILGLIVLGVAGLQRGVRTRRAYPLAFGSACMLLDTLVITALSL